MTTRVLVIDDTEDIRELTRARLVRNGFAVTLLGDGREALAYLERGGQADVILLDLAMPGIDGREVLARLTDIPGARAVPVVIYTVDRLALAGGKGLEGAVGKIDKAANEAELVRALTLAIETHEGRWKRV